MWRLGSWMLCSLLLGLYAIAPGQVVAEPRPTNGTISLDVQQAEVREILRRIAEVGQVNIIAGSDVQGYLTLHLVEIPWERALEAVLKLAGLGKERQGNVIVIATLQRLRAQTEQHQRQQQAAAQMETTSTRVIPLHYANAATLQAHLATTLGSCATLSVDQRSNTLILTGTPACLRPAQGTR